VAERTSFALPTTVHRTLPSALTDQQFQDIIDAEVLKERERCIGVLRKELAAMDTQGGVGVGWSWPKWRDKMLDALNGITPSR
jgi:hypothetical protein